MVEAKAFGNYIIEPLGSDIDRPSSYIVRKRFQDIETTTTYTTSDVDTMFSDIMLEATRPTAHGSSNMKGALIFLKNGTYIPTCGQINISDSRDAPNVMCHIVGETRDRTIIKCGFTTTGQTDMITPYCSLDIENLTIDGDSQGVHIRGIRPNSSSNGSKILRVRNCRFMNLTSFCVTSGHLQYAMDISGCIFEKGANDHTKDLVAFECTGYAHIYDNLFDRLHGGSVEGSSLTSGSAYNVNIHNNMILRDPSDTTNGISMEAFDVNPNYDNIFIHENFLQNGTISIGSTGAYDTAIEHVVIDSNVLIGAEIRILGPDIGDFSTQIKDFTIENNKIFDSSGPGLKIINTAGLGYVRNNVIKNSNASLSSTTFDKGLMYFNNCTDLVVESNDLYMGVTSPDNALFSPKGIRYGNLTGCIISDNRIINRTTAPNPSYERKGESIQTNCIISRNL